MAVDHDEPAPRRRSRRPRLRARGWQMTRRQRFTARGYQLPPVGDDPWRKWPFFAPR